MQQQELIYTAPTSELTNLHIGIQPLTDPFNLFLNLKQLVDPDKKFVYFFVYSFGKKKVVLWGYYDKNKKTFKISGGCKYRAQNLNKMVKTWEKHDQSYVSNSVKDNFSKRIAKNIGSSIMPYSEYLKNKFILAYFGHKITEKEMEKRYPGVIDQFINNFEDETGVTQLNPDYDEIFSKYLDELDEKISNYEKEFINITDIREDLKTTTYQAVKVITDRFYDAIKYGDFSDDSYYNNLKDCPDLEKCERDLNDNCEVYFYGSKYLAETDPEYLL